MLQNHDDDDDDNDYDNDDDDDDDDEGFFPWSHQIQPVMLGAFRAQNLENFDKSRHQIKIDLLLGFKD